MRSAQLHFSVFKLRLCYLHTASAILNKYCVIYTMKLTFSKHAEQKFRRLSDFFGRVFLQNSSQNGLGAPVVTARGRHETRPQPHFPPRPARAMARYSPRQYEWGELPTALQACRPSDSASLLPVKLGEIVDTRRKNRSFSTRPEKSTTRRTSANEICAINFSSRPF